MEINKQHRISFLSKSDISQHMHNNIFIFDAKNDSIGRIIARVAYILQGKMFFFNDRHNVLSPIVHITNLGELNLTGKKDNRNWYFHTGKKIKTLHLEKENVFNVKKIIYSMIKCMLPKNKLNSCMLSRVNLHLSDIETSLKGCNTFTLNSRFVVERL